ncbi:MAG TPA: hypothetical protein VK788_00930 [Terriglobales bacterium]|jgi:hypothetical protein|nr:hypothetical protein [Terriglobales bacterium]
MFRTKSLLTYTVLTASVVFLAAVSFAQTTYKKSLTYQLTYYSNALNTSAPDGTVHIVNPGSAVTKLDADGKPLDGNLCAQIYVLNNDEQEVECCGCTLTPDSERTLSINKNLLGNPINVRQVTSDGVIKIVSEPTPSSGPCRPDLELANVAQELQSWDTHIQTLSEGYAETEEEFAPAPLSANELFWLQNQCSAIYTNGSGHGKCTCGYGD